MRKKLKVICHLIRKQTMKCTVVSGVLLLAACGTKEPVATGGKVENKILQEVTASTGTSIEEEAKAVKDKQIEKDGKDEEEQIDTDKEETRVEFTIHDEKVHAIMGVTLPKGWRYSFINSSHNKNLICENAFMGKAEQSEDKDVKEFGIRFWKEENPKVKLEYYYYREKLYYCGTGVTFGTKKIKINQEPAEVTTLTEGVGERVYYTLHLDVPDTVIYKGKGDYAVKCDMERKLWEQYQDEITKILDGITLDACR